MVFVKSAVIGGTPGQAVRLGADWFDPETLDPESISGRHVFLCPTNDPRETFPTQIAKWRLQGRITLRSLGFPLYHGIHWHPLAPRVRGGERWRAVQKAIDFWVVHSEQDALNHQRDRVFFAFLPSPVPEPLLPVGEEVDVFVGGKQNRDFAVAFHALNHLSRSAIFQSDVLPDWIVEEFGSPIQVIQKRISRRSYIETMSRGRIVGIPLSEPKRPRARGQTDASIAMSLGVPIIATGGSTVDDYVVHGETGLLVANTEMAWKGAIEQILSDYDHFRERAKARRYLVSWEGFRAHINELADRTSERRP